MTMKRTMLLVAALAGAAAFGAKTQPQLKVPDLTRPWAASDFLTEHRPAAKAPVEAVRGFLWLEAEEFSDYGGWRVDTQFTHKMGSGYLIANGVGEPVKAARTAVEIPRAGVWRVWARTKDWLPEHSPGTFRVAANGETGQLLGASKRETWAWEIAGDFTLAAGRTELGLCDVSGYFGRCDALLLTTDLSYVPPEEAVRLAAERYRLRGESAVPQDRGSFDLIVVGAGSGGVPAAIAAARHGIRVALVGDRPVLGGNSSDEIGVNMCGACYDKPAGRETGIAEETTCLRAKFATPAMSRPLQRLVDAEPNITVFFNERMTEVETKDGRVAAVVCRNTMTGLRSRFRAGLFVDATGDGWLGYFAGAKYRQGREGQAEFGEKFAPEHADTWTMSGLLQEPKVGVCYWAEDTGKPVAYETPAFARILPPGFTRDAPHAFGVWWLEHPAWFDDCADPERARDELIRNAFAYWGWIKNVSPQRDAARNYRLREIPIMDGRRESRRLVGDYILNSNDCLEGRVFPDAVAYGGWPLDTHEPLGIQKADTDGHRYRCDRIPFYTIPFRSLYSTNVPNLMMSGRDISATHIALGSTRVQLTCMAIGQAVGTAAAMCVKEGMLPRELGQRRIGELQQRLLRDDAYILGFRNEDPADLARRATVTASSSATETKRFSHGETVTYRHVAPESVIDGVTRPVGDAAHAWVSAPGASLPQWIRLDFPQACEVREVRLTFDTDLEFNAWRYRIADELVRDYVVEGTADGETWFALADERDNYMRCRVHRFPPRTLKAIRLTVTATYGADEANVFEIRAY